MEVWDTQGEQDLLRAGRAIKHLKFFGGGVGAGQWACSIVLCDM